MPTCQNCQQTWTWFQSVKNMFRLKCPYCGTKQYQSANSKKKTSILSVVPIAIIFLVNVFSSLTLGTGTILLIVLLAAIFGSYPFWLQLANEEEFYP